MNSGVNLNDPTVIAAFTTALLHQGLIALLIFAVPGLAWLSLRAWLAPAARDGAAARAPVPAELAGRRLMRTGFGLPWLFDGILQAQPKMAAGLPAKFIELAAASSPALGAASRELGRDHLVIPPRAGRSRRRVDSGRHRNLDAGRGSRYLVAASRAGQRRLRSRPAARRGHPECRASSDQRQPPLHPGWLPPGVRRREGLAGVPNWLYLTGARARLRQVWRRYGVAPAKIQLTGRMTGHGYHAFVIDQAGQMRQETGFDTGPGTQATKSSFAAGLNGAARQLLRLVR
jgi:hypothetical protein